MRKFNRPSKSMIVDILFLSRHNQLLNLESTHFEIKHTFGNNDYPLSATCSHISSQIRPHCERRRAASAGVAGAAAAAASAQQLGLSLGARTDSSSPAAAPVQPQPSQAGKQSLSVEKEAHNDSRPIGLQADESAAQQAESTAAANSIAIRERRNFAPI